jgi:prolipoprotein diacylglyceryltransferase
MFPILQLGPLAIQLPGLFLLAGVWVATTLIDREAARRGLPVGAVSGMVLAGLIAGLVGARAWYALRFLSIYLESPLSLLSLNPSTLAPAEGLLTGVLAAWVYGARARLPFWPTMDALTPGMAAFAVALGFSHLASGDAFGAPSGVPWAIELWGTRRHPTQVYEILAAALILLGVWRLREWDFFPGFAFLAWLAMAAAGRLFLGGFRGDSVIWLDRLRAGQVLSLLVLLAALVALRLRGTAAALQGKEPGFDAGR